MRFKGYIYSEQASYERTQPLNLRMPAIKEIIKITKSITIKRMA